MVTEAQVKEVLDFLAEQGNVVIVWEAGDILSEIYEWEQYRNITLTDEQKQQAVKRVQGSPQWRSLADADDWQYELIFDAIEDALEVMGVVE